jgi:formylmethanofuran dehydrogenase subunit C
VEGRLELKQQRFYEDMFIPAEEGVHPDPNQNPDIVFRRIKEDGMEEIRMVGEIQSFLTTRLGDIFEVFRATNDSKEMRSLLGTAIC